MQLTTEDLARYVGGQLEVKNDIESYLFRGEIESIQVEEDGQDGTLVVRFVWHAKAEGYPALTGRWLNEENLDYRASLLLFLSIDDIGMDRLMLTSPITNEVVVLYPLGGSTLDRAKVEGVHVPAGGTSD